MCFQTLRLTCCVCVQGNAALQQLLAVESMAEPVVPSARHVFPDHSGFAPPVALPVEKDRVKLQVSCHSELMGYIRIYIYIHTYI